MARSGSLQVGVKVDALKTSQEFKDARRDINARLRVALKIAAERVALPAAAAAAWGFAKPLLIARSTSRSAYITTRGPRLLGRAVGLLEFGGLVKTRIEAKEAGGLSIGPDIVRAAVDTPRRYHPSLRLTKAVMARTGSIEDRVLEEVMQAFDGLTHSP